MQEVTHSLTDFCQMRIALHSKIWGGDALTKKYNSTTSDSKIGEVSFHPIDENIDFPLVLKLIDTAQDLSVQVHPKEKDLKILQQKDAGIRSKEETWIILGHEDKARIYLGLKGQSSEQEIRQLIEETRLVELLQKYSVNTSDLYHVPPGTIHTIGAGIFLLEIQQKSETTFRLYDYNRTDKNGKKRDLHLEQALYSLNYQVLEEPNPIKTDEIKTQSHQLKNGSYQHKCLFIAANYRVEELSCKGQIEIELCFNENILIFNLNHALQVQGENDTITLQPFEVILTQKKTNHLRLVSEKETKIYLFSPNPLQNILAIRSEV